MPLNLGPGLRSTGFIQRVKKLAPGGVCFDPWSGKRIRKFLDACPPGARIVDIGSADRALDPRIITLDVDAGAGVDIVADGHELPVRPASLDAVLLTGVLEHVRDPYRMVRQAWDSLKPGGRVYMEVPFLQGYHAHPYDFRRFTQVGVRELMKPFHELECGVGGGPSSALAWIAGEYVAAHFSGEVPYLAAKFVGRWLTFWIKYLDWISIRRPNAHMLASGFYYIGEKR